jgi:hypothetical protein
VNRCAKVMPHAIEDLGRVKMTPTSPFVGFGAVLRRVRLSSR